MTRSTLSADLSPKYCAHCLGEVVRFQMGNVNILLRLTTSGSGDNGITEGCSLP